MEKRNSELEQLEEGRGKSNGGLERISDPNEVATLRSQRLESSVMKTKEIHQGGVGDMVREQESGPLKKGIESEGLIGKSGQGVEDRSDLVSSTKEIPEKEENGVLSRQTRELEERGDIAERREQRDKRELVGGIQENIIKRIEAVPEIERRRIELRKAKGTGLDANEIAERRKKDVSDGINSSKENIVRNVWEGVPAFERLAEKNVNKELEQGHKKNFIEFDEKVISSGFEYDMKLDYVNPESIAMPVHDVREEFWNRKVHTVDMYDQLGERYKDVKSWVDNGKDWEVLKQDPELSKAVDFWLHERPVKLIGYKESFRVDGDGRHRVAVAKLYGHDDLLQPASVRYAKEKEQ